MCLTYESMQWQKGIYLRNDAPQHHQRREKERSGVGETLACRRDEFSIPQVVQHTNPQYQVQIRAQLRRLTHPDIVRCWQIFTDKERRSRAPVQYYPKV